MVAETSGEVLSDGKMIGVELVGSPGMTKEVMGVVSTTIVPALKYSLLPQIGPVRINRKRQRLCSLDCFT